MKENKAQQPLVSVIILNWNGCNDTIECLQSLAACDGADSEIIIVDNASTDNSVAYIRNWIDSFVPAPGSKKYVLYSGSKPSDGGSDAIPVYIISNSENTGFARGNNIGMTLAMKHDPQFMLLLNNDTTVGKDFIRNMLRFFASHADYAVATPQIRYYGKPELIWNCGGRLTSTGSRTYYFDDKHISALPAQESLDITFITGCALMVRTEVIREHGALTEDFFFGEEDYEFSLRMKKYKIRMACVLPAVIYHKVNSSIAKASAQAVGKIYIHYLNRFINLRNYYPRWKWQLWRYTYLLYISMLLKRRHGIASGVTKNFVKCLLKDSATQAGVNRQTFETYINRNFE